jgi:hypothetical protein
LGIVLRNKQEEVKTHRAHSATPRTDLIKLIATLFDTAVVLASVINYATIVICLFKRFRLSGRDNFVIPIGKQIVFTNVLLSWTYILYLASSPNTCHADIDAKTTEYMNFLLK